MAERGWYNLYTITEADRIDTNVEKGMRPDDWLLRERKRLESLDRQVQIDYHPSVGTWTLRTYVPEREHEQGETRPCWCKRIHPVITEDKAGRITKRLPAFAARAAALAVEAEAAAADAPLPAPAEVQA